MHKSNHVHNPITYTCFYQKSIKCADLSNFLKNIHRRRSCISACAANKHRCNYTLHFLCITCNLISALLKNGPVPGSERPIFVSTLLHDQSMGSETHNAPVLQAERVGEHKHPITFWAASNFSAAYTSLWYRAHMRREGNFTPNWKLWARITVWKRITINHPYPSEYNFFPN